MNKLKIKVDELNSSPLYLNIYELSGICEGKTVYIQANVHGAEVQGNAVIWKLVEKLKNIKFKGKIILVPQANPYGSSQKMGSYTYGRFNPITGDNWNRSYINFFTQKRNQGKIVIEQFVDEHANKSSREIVSLYKQLLKQKTQEFLDYHAPYGISDNKNVFTTLQSLASSADIVLDLHTGPVATRYIYAPKYLKEACKDLNFPHYLIIDNEFGGAMDEACFYPWHRLYQELEKRGKKIDHLFESYTVELGSEEFISMSDANNDADNILHYLNERDMLIDYNPATKPVVQFFCPLEDYRMYRAPHSGLIEYHLAPGKHFKEGDLLASLYRFDQLENLEASLTEIRALSDGIVINHTPSSNVKQGMDLIECFTYN